MRDHAHRGARIEEARAADAEIARGRYRGPVHGIHWGAKDLLAVRGYKTRGARGHPRADHRSRCDGSRASRCRRGRPRRQAHARRARAGRHLVRRDDENPWKLDQGRADRRWSSFGHRRRPRRFSIGSETMGSISSPSTRCGTNRPTPDFAECRERGRWRSRGPWTSWGPSAGASRTARSSRRHLRTRWQGQQRDRRRLQWDARVSPRSLRVGNLKSAFELRKSTRRREAHDPRDEEVRRCRARRSAPHWSQSHSG